VSSGDIPRVFALGWVYDIPRLWKIAGWQIAGIVRVQSGDAVAVTQATNNNSSLGFAVQRPNRIANPKPVLIAAAWPGTSTPRPSLPRRSSSSEPVPAIRFAGQAFRMRI